MPDIFGITKAGQEVSKFLLKNSNLLTVEIINYGATIISIKTADAAGDVAEITLGFDSCAEWLENIPYFGAICGRYCNRIDSAKFILNGRDYKLTANDGKHNLHGGTNSFSKRVWTVEDFGQDFVELSIISPDGDQGFPGTVRLTVRYSLTANDELIVNYTATTDKPTIVGFTAHPYFNLRDGGATSILDHELQIAADYYVPVNAELIPVGQLAPVDQTPFDFRAAKPIGAEFDTPSSQMLQAGGGYDHCWAVQGTPHELRHALTLRDHCSGRKLEVLTTEPGIQVYTGSFLNGTIGRNGQQYRNFGGVAIEAEPYPDSPNQPEFPSVQLKPGEQYRQTTIYRFAANTVNQLVKFGAN